MGREAACPSASRRPAERRLLLAVLIGGLHAANASARAQQQRAARSAGVREELSCGPTARLAVGVWRSLVASACAPAADHSQLWQPSSIGPAGASLGALGCPIEDGVCWAGVADASGGEEVVTQVDTKRARTSCLATEAPNATKAHILIVHGYAAHGYFPSVRLVAEHLSAEAGFHVHALDARGHGRSEGTLGLIMDWRGIVQDIADYVDHIRGGDKSVKVFLIGSSMGGALAFAAAHLNPGLATGCVFLAPMLRLREDSKPPRWQIPVLRAICYFMPDLAVIGGAVQDNSKQYADPVMCAAVDCDELAYKGKVRLGTASELLDLSLYTESQMPNFEVPFLVMHGTADIVVGPECSCDFERAAPVKDKTLKLWEGALHTLVCELPETRDQVLRDVREWILKRAA